MVIGIYAFVFGSWNYYRKDPCNPVKPPVTVTDILGNDVTTDSVWNDGIYIRSRDGISRKITIINNKQK